MSEQSRTANETRPYQSKLTFDSTHTRVISAVAPGSKVLDLGCADGYLATGLKEKGCYVVGIDVYPLQAAGVVDEFYKLDLNRDPIPLDLSEFDYILMLDVIEHLIAPEAFMRQLRMKLGDGATTRIIATTGNVAFLSVRIGLLFGRFDYQDRGILDRTHTRLFTFVSFRRLLEDAGYIIQERQGVPAPFPLVFGDSAFSRLMLSINKGLITVFKGLFSFQILYRLHPK